MKTMQYPLPKLRTILSDDIILSRLRSLAYYSIIYDFSDETFKSFYDYIARTSGRNPSYLENLWQIV
jgi:hypothetical protein